MKFEHSFSCANTSRDVSYSLGQTEVVLLDFKMLNCCEDLELGLSRRPTHFLLNFQGHVKQLIAGKLNSYME